MSSAAPAEAPANDQEISRLIPVASPFISGEA
jgi:hypothetical protein